MRIAIIGSGISGLTAARRLCPDHDVTVFEANHYIGGHTNTVDVDLDGRRWAVDTGFIVFNDRTYPNFISLMNEIGVESQPSDMGFSVRCDRSGLEYCGSSLNQLFAQRRNLVRPGFWRMLRDILRFNREARELLEGREDTLELGAYLAREGYSRQFTEQYIVPMGAAIWSTDPQTMLRFPARYFVDFFNNHGLLSVNDRPQWRVIRGGSRSYIGPLTAPFADRIQLNAPVMRVHRNAAGVELVLRDGHRAWFDGVVFACHSDQALAMLAQPTEAERSILGAIPYQPNRAVLHTDERLLPRRRAAWAAWNYHIPAERRSAVSVTYNMNILQGLDAERQFLVTLNPASEIAADKVVREIVYQHPVYTPEGVAAQRRRAELMGANRSFYCGAWWSYGFHEDGVKSGLVAAAAVQAWSQDAKLSLRRAS
ncbi:MAG TPA: FAD-dependent oxidoreductase [Gammaproteobacteria bacterium]|nr:FAD-dependent oxidoreductase [Gammaproteobacteria bacterium]